MTEGRVRETRTRLMAKQRGFHLVKSRRRDRLAIDYGRYWLCDDRGRVLMGNKSGTTLSEIEAFLMHFVSPQITEKGVDRSRLVRSP
jgi:hypothetical protein